MIPILILAAGKSTRMGGRDKLLEVIDGGPLLAIVAKRALKVGPTFVTLPSANHPRRYVLPPAAQVVEVDGEMSDSVKAGVKALPEDATGVLILLADMPDITAEDIAMVYDAAIASNFPVVRGATSEGYAGHPIYLAASLFPLLRGLSGDRGAARLYTGFEADTVLVSLKGNRCRLDLDTPADWACYRKR